jgi:hypothetical protein
MLIHAQGDTFLRSAYIVFDLDNEAVSIGKAKFNVTESNIKEIPKGKNVVPDATVASNPVIVAATASGSGRTDSMPFASGTFTMTAGGFATAGADSNAGVRSQLNWRAITLGFLIAALPIVF